jgi:hypothetical protein
VSENDPWEQVAEASQVYEAELMALRLREAGIDARVLDQSFRQEPLPNVRSFAVVRVLVPAEQAEEARRVLAQPVDMPPDIELVDESPRSPRDRAEEGTPEFTSGVPDDENSGDEKS